MKNSLVLLVLLFLSFNGHAQSAGKLRNNPTAGQHGAAQAVVDLVDLVNPLIGTDSKPSLSNGNTYPAIALPWGMNFWLPQTGKMGNGWAYTYSADRIRGFKQTHQPSPWMNDYGQFSLMPMTGKLRVDEDERASWFSHKAEVAKPYYYSVYLADHDVTTELVPTERAAMFRFTFPKTDSSFVVVDAFDKASYVKILPNERKVIGYTTRNSGGVPANFKNYFVAYFDKPFASAQTWRGKTLIKDSLPFRRDHAGAAIGFKTTKGEQIHVRIASSFISYEQAELNLNELGTNSFRGGKATGKNSLEQRIKPDSGGRRFAGPDADVLFLPLPVAAVSPEVL